MNDRGAPDEYYRAIEEEFVRRRGAAMLLSPRDWALIGDWQKAGIPLRIVLQGIANVFDSFERRATRSRRINSLAYCRQEVLALHELYLHLSAADAGRPGGGEEAVERNRAIARHLGRLARGVRRAMAVASESRLDPLVTSLALVASELKRLRKEMKADSFDPAGLEEQLRRLDEGILEATRRLLPADVLCAEEAEVNQALAPEARRMTPEAFASTSRALLARRLRQRCRLPRLTLFD